MEDNSTFWKGVSAGFLAGMAVAAALRYTPFERFISNLSTVDGKLDSTLGKMEVKLGASRSVEQASLEPEASAKPAVLKQGLPDPTLTEAILPEPLDESSSVSTLAAARTGAVASFLRNGAIEGGRAKYPITGIDLPRPDHIDLTRPAASNARKFDIGSAG